MIGAWLGPLVPVSFHCGIYELSIGLQIIVLQQSQLSSSFLVKIISTFTLLLFIIILLIISVKDKTLGKSDLPGRNNIYSYSISHC